MGVLEDALVLAISHLTINKLSYSSPLPFVLELSKYMKNIIWKPTNRKLGVCQEKAPVP